jgi:excisionase family DNA binding protein
MSQNFVENAGVEECGENIGAADGTKIATEVPVGTVAEWSDAGLLVTCDGLARLLKVSKRTLMRLRSTGKLPRPVQLGRLVRWRTAEVREWVEAGCPALSIWEPPAAGTRAGRVFRYRRAR